MRLSPLIAVCSLGLLAGCSTPAIDFIHTPLKETELNKACHLKGGVAHIEMTEVIFKIPRGQIPMKEAILRAAHSLPEGIGDIRGVLYNGVFYFPHKDHQTADEIVAGSISPQQQGVSRFVEFKYMICSYDPCESRYGAKRVSAERFQALLRAFRLAYPTQYRDDFAGR